MTSQVQPQDLKVGDVVDVTFRGLEVSNIDLEDMAATMAFSDNFGECWVSQDLLSNATITRSPEVIEVGDVVRPPRSDSILDWRVVAVIGDEAWIKTNSGLISAVWFLSDLTLVSKGAKS